MGSMVAADMHGVNQIERPVLSDQTQEGAQGFSRAPRYLRSAALAKVYLASSSAPPSVVATLVMSVSWSSAK